MPAAEFSLAEQTSPDGKTQKRRIRSTGSTQEGPCELWRLRLVEVARLSPKWSQIAPVNAAKDSFPPINPPQRASEVFGKKMIEAVILAKVILIIEIDPILR
jgi:hypothetical protein